VADGKRLVVADDVGGSVAGFVGRGQLEVGEARRQLFEAVQSRCERGDSNSHVLADTRT
jgi:hypothetical protein